MTDKEIEKVARGFTKGLLDGKSSVDMCYMVCSPLVSYLSMCGVDSILTEGEILHCENELHHFWITLSDGKIIDPTADQFGLLNIWAKKQPSYYYPYTAKDIDRIIKEELNKSVSKFNKFKPVKQHIEAL